MSFYQKQTNFRTGFGSCFDLKHGSPMFRMFRKTRFCFRWKKQQNRYVIHVPDSPKRNAPPDLPTHFNPVFPNDDLVQAKVFSSSNVGNSFFGWHNFWPDGYWSMFWHYCVLYIYFASLSPFYLCIFTLITN